MKQRSDSRGVSGLNAKGNEFFRQMGDDSPASAGGSLTSITVQSNRHHRFSPFGMQIGAEDGLVQDEDGQDRSKFAMIVGQMPLS